MGPMVGLMWFHTVLGEMMWRLIGKRLIGRGFKSRKMNRSSLQTMW